MNVIAVHEEIVDAEIVDDYTNDDFENDKAVVRRYAEALREVSRRKQEIERAATIEMARRLHRMRHDPERRWRGPGIKDTAKAFSSWAEGEVLLDSAYIPHLLSVAEGLRVLERNSLKAIFPLPATAGQIIKLSAAKIRALPDADKVIPDLWMAAVEEAGGKQPRQQLVEAIVRRYMHDRELVDSGMLEAVVGSDAATEKVKSELRKIRRQLGRLAQREPALVAAAVAEFYHAYRHVQ